MNPIANGLLILTMASCNTVGQDSISYTFDDLQSNQMLVGQDNWSDAGGPSTPMLQIWDSSIAATGQIESLASRPFDSRFPAQQFFSLQAFAVSFDMLFEFSGNQNTGAHLTFFGDTNQNGVLEPSEPWFSFSASSSSNLGFVPRVRLTTSEFPEQLFAFIDDRFESGDTLRLVLSSECENSVCGLQLSLANLTRGDEVPTPITGLPDGLVPQALIEQVDTMRIRIGRPNIFMDNIQIRAQQPCLADLNDDSVLDLTDVSLFVGAFILNEPLADLNEDGIFDLRDVNTFISAFISICGR